jgi:hypothetical protein
MTNNFKNKNQQLDKLNWLLTTNQKVIINSFKTTNQTLITLLLGILLIGFILINIKSISLLIPLVIVCLLIVWTFLKSNRQIIIDLNKQQISTYQVFWKGKLKHQLLMDRSIDKANIYVEQYTHKITTVTQLTMNGKTLLRCENKTTANKILRTINQLLAQYP